MKKYLLLLFSVAAMLSFAASLDTVYIQGKTDKSPLSYQKNEKMVFTFEAVMGDYPVENLFLSYRRHGDDGKVLTGKVPASEKLVIETSLDRAGFVGIHVFLSDSHGKKIRTERKKDIIFYAGAAVEPESLTDCGEPADFDEFWKKQREKLDKVPFKGLEKRQLVKNSAGMNFYAVTVPCAGMRPVTGFLCIPENAAPGTCAVEVQFFGYSTRRQTMPGDWIPKKRISFFVNAHGMELFADDDYYKGFAKSISSNGKAYAFDPKQNSDPETAYFNGMALRVMRSLDYVKTLPEWNGKDLIVAGGSQGGLQTMWAAALDQDVTEARPSITWCCDLAGQSKKGRTHGSWRIPYVPALDYYDSVFMAKRITNAKVYIVRAGLGDYVCPPSGLAVCWNNLSAPECKMVWVQGSTHGFVPRDPEKIVWEKKRK